MDNQGESPHGSVADYMEGEPISPGRRSRDRARQTPWRRSVQSEGADGSLLDRQVRKRSDNKSRSREPSMVISRTTHSRRQSSKINKRTITRHNETSRSRSPSRQRETPRRARKRQRSRVYDSSSDEAYEGRATRRRRRSSSGSYDSTVKRLLKRRRSREPSCRTQRKLPTEFDNLSASNQNILHKFLDVLANVKGQSTSKLSLTNVVPEFDPMSNDQTIITWLTKVEECAEIYNWNERETIHFAIPKLTGVAKLWYQGLNSVLYSWNEWKRKLIESFPCRQDYADLLIEMLVKRAKYGESLEQYYYVKINLINRCGISGRNAVDVLLNGIDDRAVRVGAQAARFRSPEDVLKYFKTVKTSSTKELGDKLTRDKKFTRTSGNDRVRTEGTKRAGTNNILIKCHNCNEEGHKSFQCKKSPSKCNACNKTGHLDQYCRSKPPGNTQNTDRCNNDAKNEKQIAVLDQPGESNLKYVIEIAVNGSSTICQVDLGSQCTLVKETEAKRLKLNVVTENLPSLRGIGGHLVQPLGKCFTDVTVQGIQENIEIIVVEDVALKYPVLLGHSFTEKPHITIVKTPDQILFEKVNEQKIYLTVQTDVTITPNQLSIIPVESVNKHSGQVYINGTVRGTDDRKHYLLPGEYKLVNGIGHLLVQNVCDNPISFKKGSLVTRSIPISPREHDVFSVSLDENCPNEVVQCGDQMTAEERLQLKDLLSEFADCFSSGLKDIGYTTAGEMVIELENTEPVVYRPYRMSYSERTLVSGMVQEMVDAGIVKESSSPYASPIVLVKKKTGEKRLCVDYRALNKRTKKDHYPLPLIDDQLDRLAGNNLFISLDLASGYYQIPIEPSSQDKTAFITPDGQFQFTRMPFGLVNAPSVFQRTINKILAEAKIKYALVYMDDILIPAHSFTEGLERLKEVLALLRQGGLTLKMSKCHFFMKSIEFLGFEINSDGIKPGTKKIEAVAKFPVPKSQRELQQFIGLASFFRRFVQGFATLAKPLTDLLRKNSEFAWGTEQDSAFENIKSRLTQRPLLALYDPKRETQVHTDASKFGIGGILLQRDDAGMFRPVSYFSKKTTPD